MISEDSLKYIVKRNSLIKSEDQLDTSLIDSLVSLEFDDGKSV